MSGGTLTVSADEVSLTFHANDAHGLPVNDLKPDEITIRDSGKPPARVLAFYPMTDEPIRGALLLDTSESMFRDLPASRAIALQAVHRILRGPGDRATVIEFGYVSNLRQDWTGDEQVLKNSIASISTGKANPLPGTALFDAVFRACFYGTGKIDHAAGGNFILLFSDGGDNAGQTTLAEAVDACQRTNTAIYAFSPGPAPGVTSTGPRTLVMLAQQTGGRVFPLDDSAEGIANNLGAIEANLRNQYRIVYKPAEIKHDGSFHAIELLGPDRVARIQVRSGYYAPAH